MRKARDRSKSKFGVMMKLFKDGELFYPDKFVQEVELFARENNALLTFDEMQAGFGELATFWLYALWS